MTHESRGTNLYYRKTGGGGNTPFALASVVILEKHIVTTIGTDRNSGSGRFRYRFQ